MKKRLIALLLCAATVLSCCVFGAAAETMTEEEKQAVLQQRRDIAEAHMRSICTFMWRPEEDIHYCRVPGSLPEDAESSIHLVAGRLYRGLPYSYCGGSLETFRMLASESDDNGVHTVSGLNWQMLNGGSKNGRFGTDCSGSVCQSWSQIGNSFTFKTTGLMAPQYGFLQVGEYAYSNSVVNDDNFTQNSEQTMYAAYAQVQKADALVHEGHVRMAVSVNVVYNEDDTINGDESTITFLEQTTTWLNRNDCYYDDVLGETVYNICGVDITYSFKTFYDYCYVPITCKELIDPSTVEAPIVTDSLEKEDYGFDTLLDGTITTNNWTIDYLQMTITDDRGKTVQQGLVAAPRETDAGANRYKLFVRHFDTEYRERMLGYIAPDALAAGDYHCKLLCRLSNGAEFTVRDFDFTVTGSKNDIHKAKLDFTAGTVHDCPMCGGKAVQWRPLTADHVGYGNGPASGHYYLSESLSNDTYTAFSGGGNFCLHLNGNDITSTERAIYVGDDSTLNIMGEGAVTGTYASTETYGVALDVTGGTVNLYGGEYRHNKGKNQRPIVGLRDSGKLKMYDGASIVGNLNAVRSSVMIRKGRFEMYGGLVEEGYGSNGGNFIVGYTQNFYPCYLLVYGGTIRTGHSSGAAGGGNIYAVYDSHVYIHGGEIYGGEAKLGGNISLHKGANAFITGGELYGGTASVQGSNIYANNLEDTKLEICLRNAGVRISGDARIEGNVEYNAERNAFVKIENGVSLVKNNVTAARYPTAEDAVANYGGCDYLRLHDGQSLALPEGAWKVDLNGQSAVMTGAGQLEASVDGGVTFDALDVRLTHVNLRPENVGIYYTGDWNIGAGLTQKVAASGVAVSLVKMPGVDFAKSGSVIYTKQAGASPANSVLIDGIFKEGATNNQSRGKRPIYAAPYVMFADGSTVVRGDAPAYSLYDILKQVDESDDTDALQKADAFCKEWYSVIKPWGFVNIGNG